MDLPANFDFALEPHTAYCIISAAHRFWLPPEALLALLFVEGGRPGIVHKNDNGSVDLGPMQTNEIWLSPKSPLYGYVTAQTLRDNVCGNIHSAAWIIATHVKQAKDDIWAAIGRYHSPGNDQLAAQYKVKVNKQVPRAREVLRSEPVYVSYVHQFFAADPQGSAPAVDTSIVQPPAGVP